MKRFILVGTIDEVFAVLKAMGEMTIFKTQSLYAVLGQKEEDSLQQMNRTRFVGETRSSYYPRPNSKFLASIQRRNHYTRYLH